MVTPQVPAKPGRKKKVRVRRGTLTKKLLRDMRRSAMQFLAMLFLCAMGTWVFSGLDATWRMLEASTEGYIQEGKLADFWVKGATFTKHDLTRLSNLPGVKDAQARISLEMECPDLPGDVTLAVSGYDGDMRICTPLIRQGRTLPYTDLRGCLLEEQFANYHGIGVGDAITIDVLGQRRTFTVRGIILSSEYLITAKAVTPEPDKYGFMYVSARALPELPFTEILIDLEDGADADAVQASISQAVPSALTISQGSHGSTVTARNFVSMFRSLSYLFPILVYAIAAMIVVSTLNRMMENQRIQMGTLKALGYRDGQIRRHYLSYALVPSIVGSVVGMLVGQVSIPPVIWTIVETNVRYPACVHAPISDVTWAITVLSVVLSVFICLRTYNKAAKETTASLLRPKPPKSGTRILLERITFLWRRFSFNTKMIIRNLLRNKGRTFMTLVGILCCNSLIICTFGLQESFEYFIGQYYDGTLKYDLRVDLMSEGAGTLESYRKRLDATAVDGVMEIAVSMYSDTDSRSGLLTVMTDDQTTMQLGADMTLLSLPREGIALSRKLATLMDVGIGDDVEVWLTGDDQPLTLTIGALAETNIGQGAFMSKDAWEKCRKGNFAPTALLLVEPTERCVHFVDEMSESSGLSYPPEQHRQTMSIMDSTKAAFTVLSVAALALAFIICYNMGLMNFTERTRDYATLKVLGYHQKEIRKLMMRENNYITILGLVLGVPPGIWLTEIILKMCEYDSMVFASNVTWPSLAISCAITYVFSQMIESLLTRKVRSIDMVEALKSVE